MSEAFERREVALERHKSVEASLENITQQLARMDQAQRAFEVEVREQLAVIKERQRVVKGTLAPLSAGAASGGVIAAIAEILKRVLS